MSDVHGNWAAFEAVLEDLQLTAPDLILHGGDLAHAGASPAEIIDCIRYRGWGGVMGNTDELLFRPESLDEFASQSSAPPSLWQAIREMAEATRAAVGEDRITWLRGLPRIQTRSPLALVHATPESLWRAPTPEAADAELESACASLGQAIAVYGHIHRSYVRRFPSPPFQERLVANSSLSLSYDGDRRACYLLFDGASPTIRRVEYDLEKEIKALAGSRLPHADWIAGSLRAASPQMP